LGAWGAVAPAAFPAIYSPVRCLLYMFDFKILFAILFIIIIDEIFQLSHSIFIIYSSFQENTKCESSCFADTCTRRVPIFKMKTRCCETSI
jgi:hypothetical protein